MAASISSGKPPMQTFEFTKRKRWSETLFSELSETIIFVLSRTCKVIFCGAAVVALLGWKEDQLIDADLTAFIEDEDQDNFRWSFTESLRTGKDMFIYARFKSELSSSSNANNNNMTQLFEVKGHPYYTEGKTEPQCLFLTAMPYPSRNIAMLNTFLDLKIENERLSKRINELRKSVEAPSQPAELGPSSPPQFPKPSYLQRFGDSPHPPRSSFSRGGADQLHYANSDPSTVNPSDGHKDMLSKCDVISLPSLDGIPPIGGEDDENGHRKKKPKKLLVGDEQRVCVTCGRTDSPEWRKGPLGPKTLCNACGLRWAKRSRRPESDSSPVQSASSIGRADDNSLHFVETKRSAL